jgi:hypothetical protein
VEVLVEPHLILVQTETTGYFYDFCSLLTPKNFSFLLTGVQEAGPTWFYNCGEDMKLHADNNQNLSGAAVFEPLTIK